MRFRHENYLGNFMSIFSRIFGISRTKTPSDPGCWKFSEGKIELDLSRSPELSNIGGAIRLEGGGLKKRVLLIHGNDGQFHAFHNQCTHAKRKIDPLLGSARVECCSVGKSTWDYQGKFLSGSAKKDIPILTVEKKNGLLVVMVE